MNKIMILFLSGLALVLANWHTVLVSSIEAVSVNSQSILPDEGGPSAPIVSINISTFVNGHRLKSRVDDVPKHLATQPIVFDQPDDSTNNNEDN